MIASRFDADIQRDLANAERDTANNTRLNLNVALSYGARAEIVGAARALAVAAREGRLDPETIDEVMVAAQLATSGMPDPDLIIRTSGEQRLSNFLLWQACLRGTRIPRRAVAGFRPEHFAAALAEYARRERRFGARPG